MDDRMQSVAVWISGKLARWYVTAGWFAILFAWVAGGLIRGFTDSWQLWANTPTTWYELFMEQFIITAAVLVNRKADKIQDANQSLAEQNHRLEEQNNELLRHIETLLEGLR